MIRLTQTISFLITIHVQASTKRNNTRVFQGSLRSKIKIKTQDKEIPDAETLQGKGALDT